MLTVNYRSIIIIWMLKTTINMINLMINFASNEGNGICVKTYHNQPDEVTTTIAVIIDQIYCWTYDPSSFVLFMLWYYTWWEPTCE